MKPLVLIVASLMIVSCRPSRSASIRCLDTGDCPEGMICGPDGVCVRPGDGGPSPGCLDEDQDGFDGYSLECPSGPDCNDQNAAVHPGAEELCADGIDNNCSGEIDEDCQCHQGATRQCFSGDPAELNRGVCHEGIQICGAGGVFDPCQGEQTAQPMELCDNTLDDDCDGEIDEDCDCDPNCRCNDPGAGPGCVCNPPTNQPCYSGPAITGNQGPCHGGTRDCVDVGGGVWRWTSCGGEVLPVSEVCGDLVDNDCDGTADDGCDPPPDLDGDGFSVAAGDCDDHDASRHPGADELCNGLDDDCDGDVDAGCPCVPGEGQYCYTGSTATADVPPCYRGWQSCEGNLEFASWGPCDGQALPGLEVCDGEDNDCDGEIDEQGALGANGCGYCVFAETQCDGVDEDCDGLVDEGLINSCGLCPPDPCYTETYGQPGTCTVPGRDCSGTGPWPSDPAAITLTEGDIQTPYIYIAVHSKHELAQLDTSTGIKNWQVSAHGLDPSRTAVAWDYSVWLANRSAWAGDWNDPANSNAVHFDVNGNLICRADIPGVARGLAIDGDGNVWVGTFETQMLYKVDGSLVDNTQTPPRCHIIASRNVGVSIYGLAVDGLGNVWTASSPHTLKVDSQNIDNRQLIANPAYYGIAVDRNGNVWFGDWFWGSGVHRLSPPAYGVTWTSVTSVTGLAVDLSGYVWGTKYSDDMVVKIDPNTGQQVCAAYVNCGPYTGPCTQPHGVAALMDGTIWVPVQSAGYVSVHDAATCNFITAYEVDAGNSLYTYSDMAGMALMTITTQQGHWKQNFDAGYDNPYWSNLHWNAVSLPAETTVEATVRTAPTEGALQTAPTADCGPFDSVPGPNAADLSVCPWIQDNRWLQVDLVLRTTRNEIRPAVSEVRVDWSYIP